MHQCAHHDHAPQNYGWAFAIGVALNLVFVIIEAGFGLWSNSLALLADAGHNLSDVLGLLLAWGGYALAKVAPSPHRTYGWRGSTILAALFNGLLLLLAIGGIAWEAIGRLANPSPVAAPTIIVVASIGVAINTGEVIAGNIGSTKRVKYGVVGHNVNLTARMESICPAGEILVSRATFNQANRKLKQSREFEIAPKGRVERLKGCNIVGYA